MSGRILGALGLLLVCACAESSVAKLEVEAVESDVFISSSMQDTILVTPEVIRRWHHGYILVDPAQGSVTHLHDDRRVQWVYRRPGRGPGELSMPTHVAMQSEDRLAVLDLSLQKIIELDTTGTWLADKNWTMSGTSFLITSFELLSGDSILFFGARPEAALAIAEYKHLAPIRTLPVDWPESSPIRWAMRSATTSFPGGPSRGWVQVFRHAPFFILNARGHDLSFEMYLHRAPFWRLGSGIYSNGSRAMARLENPQPDTLGALDVAADRDSMWILVERYDRNSPQQPHVGSNIEVYSTAGEHAYTVKLPVAAVSLAVHGPWITVLTPPPAQVIRFRLLPTEGTRM